MVEAGTDESSLGIAATVAVTLPLLGTAVTVSGCGVNKALTLLNDDVTSCRVVKAFVNLCVRLDAVVSFALLVWEDDKPILLFLSARSSCDLRMTDSSSSVEAFTTTVALS